MGSSVWGTDSSANFSKQGMDVLWDPQGRSFLWETPLHSRSLLGASDMAGN